MEVREIASYPAVTCESTTSFLEAAQIMRKHNVGCLVVVDRHGIVKGIVTDRDLVMRGIVDEQSFAGLVGEVMSMDLCYVYEDDDIFHAATQMASRECRRLPVMNGSGQLVGVIALDDLIQVFSDQIQKLSFTVRSEVGGRSVA